MFYFCFNDCIPKGSNQYLLVQSLNSTLTEYKILKEVFPDDITGIVTEKSPKDIIIDTNNFSLFNCISMLDRSLRIFAHSVFNKLPIDGYLKIKDEESLINNSYTTSVNNISYDALNLVIYCDNGSVLFTLALHDHLKKNKIEIYCNTILWNGIDNLFGHPLNTSIINKLIEDDKNSSLDNFEKLLALIGVNVYSKRFKQGFDQATGQVQESILIHFQKAIDRNGSTKFYSDEDLIKDVTPIKETKIKICELRIFNPVAYRIYFYESSSIVYLGLIENKPPNKVQNNHIKNAISIIKQLEIINK